MQIFLIILLILSSLSFVFLHPFATKVQNTTLWLGKKLYNNLNSDVEKIGLSSSRGFQDAITPKFQIYLNSFITIASPIIILISGSILNWYLGIVVLLLVIFLTKITSKLYSNNLNYYISLIVVDLLNRKANYLKENDILRADAASDVREDIIDILSSIIELNLPVPSVKEINKL